MYNKKRKKFVFINLTICFNYLEFMPNSMIIQNLNAGNEDLG
ncbi:hypothetical protein MHK_007470 [Candidatus Magnetomorum sp. HK-1]|nr:hypothetical protein MHK_007470 [Candidatus Magnetomorum sp. HK-1]